MNDIEIVILKALLEDEKYFGVVYPFLKESIFSNVKLQEVFKLIKSYVDEYGKKPSLKDFILYFKNQKLTENLKKELSEIIKLIAKSDVPDDEEFLYKESEKYIQKQSLTDSILKSAELIEKDKDFNVILGLIEQSLAINFDTELGLKYDDLDGLKQRYDYYTKKILGIPLGIPSIDKALANGIPKRTLNIIVGASHSGKSMMCINSTANFLLRQKNVIYFTLEMTEEEIAKRIDANLINVPINSIKNLSFEEYENKFKKLGKLGHLRIKEYPAGFLNVTRIKSYLQKLRNKDGFTPDVLVIDYLGLMSSSRVSLGKAGSYQYYKSIAEEVHGLSKELDIPILTAFQLNRSAYNNTEAGMETISDSIGIVQTADSIIAILSNEKMRQEKTVMLKFLKNRIGGHLSSHIVKFEPEYSRFTDLEEIPDYTESKILEETTDDLINQSIFKI